MRCPCPHKCIRHPITDADKYLDGQRKAGVDFTTPAPEWDEIPDGMKKLLGYRKPAKRP